MRSEQNVEQAEGGKHLCEMNTVGSESKVSDELVLGVEENGSG